MESWKKTFAVIWSGQLASILSSEVVAYSIIFWMSLETGSAEVLALAAIAGMLPQSLLGPLVGVYVDRWDRKRTMILADSFIALCTLALTALFWLGAARMLDVAGAAIACISLLCVRIPNPARDTTRKPDLWREFREGFSAMHAIPGMGWFFTLAIVVWFFIMPVGVMFPLMTLQHFGGGAFEMSLIEIVWGGGALVGGAVMGARTYRVSRIVLVNLMYLVVGLSFALSGLLSPAGFLWFALFTAAAGISSSVFNASFVSVVQTRIEAGMLGRVMSLYRSFGLLPAALGLLGTGFLAENVGLTTTFVVAGTIIVAVGAAGFFIPSVMRLDRNP